MLALTHSGATSCNAIARMCHDPCTLFVCLLFVNYVSLTTPIITVLALSPSHPSCQYSNDVVYTTTSLLPPPPCTFSRSLHTCIPCDQCVISTVIAHPVMWLVIVKCCTWPRYRVWCNATSRDPCIIITTIVHYVVLVASRCQSNDTFATP